MGAAQTNQPGHLGFRPWEISALANRHVLDTHVTEAAFLWVQRERAATAPQYRLRHLARLEDRLDGHLEGLRHAGRTGCELARRRLDNCDAGMVFVVAHLALQAAAPEQMRRALNLALSRPEEFSSALVTAVAWTTDRGEMMLSHLEGSPLAEHQRIALALTIENGQDPGYALAQAAESAHTPLRALGLRTIGEFKRGNLMPLLHRAEHDCDEACQFWAAYSRALMGDAGAARMAWALGHTLPHLWRVAIDVGMRCGEPGWARETIRALAMHEETLRRAVQASAAFGDPQVVPWLIRLMSSPPLARAAGEAFSIITGVDLYDAQLSDSPPQPVDLETDDDDDDLPWPRQQAIESWWSSHRHGFLPGKRFLSVQPITQAAALDVLRNGYQRQRAGAAIEWARLIEGAPLFRVTKRAREQQRRLAPA